MCKHKRLAVSENYGTFIDDVYCLDCFAIVDYRLKKTVKEIEKYCKCGSDETLVTFDDETKLCNNCAEKFF